MLLVWQLTCALEVLFLLVSWRDARKWRQRYYGALQAIRNAPPAQRDPQGE